jgi:uncharacterized protein YlxW (UPF0749 family)
LANGSALASDNKSVLINRLIETENLLLREQVGKETHKIKSELDQLSKEVDRNNQEIEKFQDQVNASLNSANDRIESTFERYDSYFNNTMIVVSIILGSLAIFVFLTIQDTVERRTESLLQPKIVENERLIMISPLFVVN